LSLQQGLQQDLSGFSDDGQLSNGLSGMTPQTPQEPAGNSRHLNRHSMEASLAAYSQANFQGQALPSETARPSLINSSYSTNDVPTLKNATGLTNITPPRSQAQHFHNHNASLGRIPPNAINNRHSREISSAGNDSRREEQSNGYHQINSVLQATAGSFGPTTTTAAPVESIPSQVMQYNNPMTYGNQQYYGGYNMQMMNMGMNPMMANPLAFQNQMQMFQPQNGFSPYPNYGQQGRTQDNQTRVMQQRRIQNGEGKVHSSEMLSRLILEPDHTRYAHMRLEDLQGEILEMCKDQHGCRYLQKKLEERNPDNVHMIFMKTYPHVVELMTGEEPISFSENVLADMPRSIWELSLPEAA